MKVSLVLAALAALLLVPTAGARTESATHAQAKATKITVTAGSPSEFRFKLSKVAVPVGTVVFKVVNKGTIPHDFSIAKHKTKLIQPGKSATLRVRFKKAGRYAYLCTVSGHAAAGMKGVLLVGSAKGAKTKVSVTAGSPSEFRFKLSKKSVPAGTVVFTVKNAGNIPHDFSIAKHTTRLIQPGKTAKLAVAFAKAGKYPYLCTVSGHAAAGMKGVLRVR